MCLHTSQQYGRGLGLLQDMTFDICLACEYGTTVGMQRELLEQLSHVQRTCWEPVLAGNIPCSSKQPDNSGCLVADELGAAVEANVSHNAALPRQARDALVQQQQDTAKQSYHGLMRL